VKIGVMPEFKLLAHDEWCRLRDIRLSALRESPDAFLSRYEQEKEFGEDRWRAEFIRGDWNIGILEDRTVSLLGATREPGSPAHECYLEYMWVSPEHRRSGIAIRMLTVVLGRLRAAGVRTVFLWVLDGNETAMRLYKRAGFARSNYRQPLPSQPGRTEERMHLDLG